MIINSRRQDAFLTESPKPRGKESNNDNKSIELEKSMNYARFYPEVYLLNNTAIFKSSAKEIFL